MAHLDKRPAAEWRRAFVALACAPALLVSLPSAAQLARLGAAGQVALSFRF
jgi:hypothetical protein